MDPASASTSLGAALVAGLVGSTHCLGMCGGIAAALGMGTAGTQAGPGRRLTHALLYNAGRIASYALAGALIAGIGFAVGRAVHLPAAGLVLRGLTGVLLIAIGLQVAFNLRPLRFLETLGMRIWRPIAPRARGLMARGDALGSLALGALWGWLPCGLVYAMLLTAATTGDPAHGAALMVAFGLGTAPAMVATGAAGSYLKRLSGDRRFRRVAGLVVIALGAATAAWPLAMVLGRASH